VSVHSMLVAPWFTVLAAMSQPSQQCDASEATLFHDAELVIVGTFHPSLPYPWFGGWHFTGAFTVEQTLTGASPARELPFHIVAPYAATDIRAAWPVFRRGARKATFFLKRDTDGTWSDLRAFCVYAKTPASPEPFLLGLMPFPNTIGSSVQPFSAYAVSINSSTASIRSHTGRPRQYRYSSAFISS